MRSRLGLIVLLVVVLVLAACQPARLRPPIPLPGGVRNFPDPTVFFAEGEYWAYSTTSFSSPVRNIQVMHSTDLYSWEGLTNAMPTQPSWAHPVSAGGEYWAPTIGKFGSTYVLYFGAKHRNAPANRPGWCIGYATSTSPGGPFTPASRPLICQVLGHSRLSPVSTAAPSADRGVFDPQIYVAPNGATYLHFKANDNPYQLWGVGLSSSGQSIRTQGYGMVEFDDQATGAWEYSRAPDHGFTILENPSMDYNAAGSSRYRYYLYYSGGDWRTSSYGSGVAACQGPLGPCFRATTSPWLASRGSAGGPGGLSVFRTATGSRWVAYHTWERGQPASNGRRLHLEPLGYDGITPVLLNRGPTGTFNVAADVATVTFSGRADDPDTGRRSVVIIKEGSTVIAQPSVNVVNSYSITRAATPGSHTYCAFLRDDNGLGTRPLGCRTVTVGAPPAAPPAGPPPEVTTTSTAPTSTWTSTSLVPSP